MDKLRLRMVPQRVSLLLSAPASRTCSRLLYPVVHEQIRHHSSLHPHHTPSYAPAVYHVAHPSFDHSVTQSFYPPHHRSMHQSIYPSVQAHDDAHYQFLNKLKDYQCTSNQLRQICHHVIEAIQTKHTSITFSDLIDDLESVSHLIKHSIDHSINGHIDPDVPLSVGSVACFASLIAGKSVRPLDKSTPLLDRFHYTIDSDGAHIRWSHTENRLIVKSCVHFLSLMHSVCEYESAASILSQRSDVKLNRIFSQAPSESELKMMIKCYERLVERSGHAWYLYDAEWDVDPTRTQDGKGDLVFTNLLGFKMTVECKNISGTDKSASRKKLREQTKFYSDVWRKKDAEAICVLAASFSNENRLFYPDDENEMIAVESIKRSVHCMLAVSDHWREQVADATSLAYVSYLKGLIEKHTVKPIIEDVKLG